VVAGLEAWVRKGSAMMPTFSSSGAQGDEGALVVELLLEDETSPWIS